VASIEWKNKVVFVQVMHNRPLEAAAHAASVLQPSADAMAQSVQVSKPWQSRTGRLEASIAGYVLHEAGSTSVTVGVGYDQSAVSDAGFPYGTRLEHDYQGRFAILGPTLHQHEAGIVDTAVHQVRGGQ